MDTVIMRKGNKSVKPLETVGNSKDSDFHYLDEGLSKEYNSK